ncbi:MAG: phosphoribosylanthranilate isomerase [Bacteroidales bacterium]|nr:phosphoribosylanthranilate isomerase [Bacteroidales bacterium]
MRDPQNLEQVCALAPEFVGFIFYPRSKRFVGSSPDPALFAIPGPGIKKVGVFVNEKVSLVRKVIEVYGLDVVQLHGAESVDYCRNLAGEPVEVIKALDPDEQRSGIEKYRGVVDRFLFDSAGEGYGGTGQKFDWKVLENLRVPAPFLLSGGIGPGDAGALRTIGLKGLMGIDINSRFELSPGRKDIEQLKEFIIEIRK